MNCPNCGAPLHDNERYCPYCGGKNPMYTHSEYNTKVRVEYVQPGTKKFVASCALPDSILRHAGTEETMKIVKRQLAGNLAEKIINELPIYMNDMVFDPRDCMIRFEVPIQVYTREWE